MGEKLLILFAFIPVTLIAIFIGWSFTTTGLPLGGYELKALRLGKYWFSQKNEDQEKNAQTIKEFTKEQLATYNGENGNPVYIAILGEVFDVSSKRHLYAAGKQYSGFAGRDATRAFIDLCFTDECLNKSLDDLTDKQRDIISEWHLFYKDKYPFVGTLKRS